MLGSHERGSEQWVDKEGYYQRGTQGKDEDSWQVNHEFTDDTWPE